MPTTDTPDSRPHRITAWAGHRWMALLVTLIALAAPMDLFSRHGIAIMAVKTVWTLAVVTVVALGMQHDQNLCEPCIATMPLDGSAEADRRRQRLRIVHTGKGLVGIGVYVAFMLAPSLLPSGPIRFGGDLVALLPAEIPAGVTPQDIVPGWIARKTTATQEVEV